LIDGTALREKRLKRKGGTWWWLLDHGRRGITYLKRIRVCLTFTTVKKRIRGRKKQKKDCGEKEKVS